MLLFAEPVKIVTVEPEHRLSSHPCHHQEWRSTLSCTANLQCFQKLSKIKYLRVYTQFFISCRQRIYYNSEPVNCSSTCHEQSRGFSRPLEGYIKKQHNSAFCFKCIITGKKLTRPQLKSFTDFKACFRGHQQCVCLGLGLMGFMSTTFPATFEEHFSVLSRMARRCITLLTISIF